jgi:hypothetical protein
MTEEGTRVQLFCRMWKRASIVYDHTALCYHSVEHQNFTGGEVVWEYVNITQCPSCRDSSHSISWWTQAFYAIKLPYSCVWWKRHSAEGLLTVGRTITDHLTGSQFLSLPMFMLVYIKTQSVPWLLKVSTLFRIQNNFLITKIQYFGNYSQEPKQKILHPILTFVQLKICLSTFHLWSLQSGGVIQR